MDADKYKKGCKACDISQGNEQLAGGIIKLDKFWILNHYQGPEAFLGWLALQPSRHVMELSDLTKDELVALGPNIKRIDKALHTYWKNNFPEDPIERVYVVYFFESAYEWPPSKYHLHLHLIARPRCFRGLQRNGDSQVGWRLYDVKTHPSFPVKYRPREETVSILMNSLRGKPK